MLLVSSKRNVLRKDSLKSRLKEKQKKMNIKNKKSISDSSVEQKTAVSSTRSSTLNDLSFEPISLQKEIGIKRVFPYRAKPFFLDTIEPKVKHSDKFKTEICRNFEIHGKCQWGDNCTFAHGKAELRTKTIFNDHYKTKICNHYHKRGLCPYSSRCQYFHFSQNKIYQDLLDCKIDKILTSFTNEEDNLDSVLKRGEKLIKRLPVFERLVTKPDRKSLLERFYELDF